MKKAFFAAVLTFFYLVAGAAFAQEAAKPSAEVASNPSPAPHIAYLDKTETVYVTTFDASAQSAPAGASKSDAPPIDSGSAGSERLNATGLEPPAALPAAPPRLAKLMADDLMSEIKKLGYKVKFVGPRDARPDSGVLVAGVFINVGPAGDIRRAELGSSLDGATQVAVTAVNLYRTPKPMYDVADKKAPPDPTAPIIFNPEVAVLKFPLAGPVNEKTVKKTAGQIAAALDHITQQAVAAGLGGSSDPVNRYAKP
jgi:hypothetical protein